jgi:peptide/nickel transport system permease protein
MKSAGNTDAAAPAVQQRSPGFWTRVAGNLLHHPVAIAAALILLALLFLAIFSPYILPADPFQQSVIRRLKPIGTPGFPLGTDELGRDMLSRLLLGTRLSFVMGITPVVIAFFIGSALGIWAGYASGWVNTVIMRVIDVLYAFPSVLLAVALSGVLGAGIKNALLSLTIVFIPQIARIAESITTQVRSSDYVDAARTSGASAFTIVRVHVLNNVLGPIFVFSTSLVAVSMILASGLSFLGLGVSPPDPEWGFMLNKLSPAIYRQPLVAALPGAMIFITSISFNMLSDGLRSAMDIQS